MLVKLCVLPAYRSQFETFATKKLTWRTRHCDRTIGIGVKDDVFGLEKNRDSTEQQQWHEKT